MTVAVVGAVVLEGNEEMNLSFSGIVAVFEHVVPIDFVLLRELSSEIELQRPLEFVSAEELDWSAETSSLL